MAITDAPDSSSDADAENPTGSAGSTENPTGSAGTAGGDNTAGSAGGNNTDEPAENPTGSAGSAGGDDNAEAAVARARAAFDDGRTRSMEWRLDQLDGLLRLIDREEKRFIAALAEDLGRPTLEAYVADLAATANEITHIRKNFRSWAKPRRASLPMSMRPGRGEIIPEPLGVALVIAPWNYPVQLLLEPMAAALAAGNTVVAKPSELAPATSAVLADVLPRYLDPEAIAVVEGGVDVSTALLEQHVDHVFFTGSTRVGRVVMEAAAKHLTPVVLELGGKSPAIIDESADIEVAGRRLAWGKWLNAGQTCIAPDYLLVTESKRDELVASIRTAIEEFSGGNVRTSPDYARVVNDSHFERLVSLREGHGGEIAVGGDSDAAERFIEPTVIVDPDPASPLMSEEIFGPLLPVLTVKDLDEAIRFVNDRPKPLALYVFADETGVADQVLAETSSGGACINHTIVHITPSTLPFGGVGPSGMGRYHGQSGFDTFSNLKSVMRKKARPDAPLAYPPYTSLKERVLRRLL